MWSTGFLCFWTISQFPPPSMEQYLQVPAAFWKTWREINWSGEEETLFFFSFFAFVDNHSVATVVVGVFLFLFCWLGCSSDFCNLFWLEMKPQPYFLNFSIFWLFYWNFLLRVGREQNGTITFIFLLSHPFPTNFGLKWILNDIF